jgi:hypothetical protein
MHRQFAPSDITLLKVRFSMLLKGSVHSSRRLIQPFVNLSWQARLYRYRAASAVWRQ